MGLLAEIQTDAISDATPASTLLRKCLVLAHNLDSNLLEDWVLYELNGYPKGVEVPDYRRIPMNFKASLQNIAYRYTGQPVPQVLVAKATGDKDVGTFKCRQAIGTINENEIRDSGTLVVNLDNYALLMDRAGCFDSSYSVTQFWGEIASPSVMGIVDAVRNRVLEFALALSRKYPNAGEVAASLSRSQRWKKR